MSNDKIENVDGNASGDLFANQPGNEALIENNIFPAQEQSYSKYMQSKKDLVRVNLLTINKTTILQSTIQKTIAGKGIFGIYEAIEEKPLAIHFALCSHQDGLFAATHIIINFLKSPLANILGDPDGQHKISHEEAMGIMEYLSEAKGSQNIQITKLPNKEASYQYTIESVHPRTKERMYYLSYQISFDKTTGKIIYENPRVELGETAKRLGVNLEKLNAKIADKKMSYDLNMANNVNNLKDNDLLAKDKPIINALQKQDYSKASQIMRTNQLKDVFEKNADPFKVNKLKVLRNNINILKKMPMEQIVDFMIKNPNLALAFLKKRPMGYEKLAGFNFRKELCKQPQLIEKMITEGLGNEIETSKLLESRHLDKNLKQKFSELIKHTSSIEKSPILEETIVAPSEHRDDQTKNVSKSEDIKEDIKEEVADSTLSETSHQKTEENDLIIDEQNQIDQLLLDAEKLFPEKDTFDDDMDEMESITKTFQAEKDDNNIEVENFFTELHQINNDFLKEKIAEMKIKLEFFSDLPSAEEAKDFVDQLNEALSRPQGLNYENFEEILLSQPNSAFMAINISHENFPEQNLKSAEQSHADINSTVDSDEIPSSGPSSPRST